MLSSSRLLGTPKRTNGAEFAEFTPIGKLSLARIAQEDSVHLEPVVNNHHRISIDVLEFDLTVEMDREKENWGGKSHLNKLKTGRPDRSGISGRSAERGLGASSVSGAVGDNAISGGDNAISGAFDVSDAGGLFGRSNENGENSIFARDRNSTLSATDRASNNNATSGVGGGLFNSDRLNRPLNGGDTQFLKQDLVLKSGLYSRDREFQNETHSRDLHHELQEKLHKENELQLHQQIDLLRQDINNKNMDIALYKQKLSDYTDKFESELIQRDRELANFKSNDTLRLKEVESLKSAINEYENSLKNSNDEIERRINNERSDFERKMNNELSDFEKSLTLKFNKELSLKDREIQDLRSKIGTDSNLNTELKHKDDMLKDLSKKLRDAEYEIQNSRKELMSVTKSKSVHEDDLHRKLNEKDREINELKSSLRNEDNLIAESRNLNKKLKENSKEIDQLQFELSQLRQSKNISTHAQHQLEAQSNTISQLRNDLQRAELDVNGFKRNLDLNQRTIDDLKSSLNHNETFSRENQSLKLKLDDFSRTLDLKDQLINDNQREIAILSEKIQSLLNSRATNAENQRIIQDLNSEITSLNNKLRDTNNSSSFKESRLHEYQATIDGLEKTISELNSRLIHKDSELLKLNSDIQAWKLQQTSIHSNHFEKDDEIKRLKLVVEEDKDRINFYERDYEALKVKLELSTKQLEMLKASEVNLKNQILKLEGELNSNRSYVEPVYTRDRSEFELNQLRTENSKLRRELSSSDANITGLRSELSIVNNSQSNLRDEIRRLKSENINIQSIIDSKIQEIDTLRSEVSRRGDKIIVLENERAEGYKSRSEGLFHDVDNIVREFKSMNLKSKSSSDNDTGVMKLLEYQLKVASEDKDRLSKDLKEAQNEIKQLGHELYLQDRKSVDSDDLKSMEVVKKEMSDRVVLLEKELATSSSRIKSLVNDLRSAESENVSLEKNIRSMKQNAEKFNHLSLELKFTRARVADIVLRYQLLYYAYGYISQSSDISRQLLSNKSYVFDEYGPQAFKYPERKLTFAAVAKFVLASVRMKRRAAETARLQSEIKDLREDVMVGRKIHGHP